MKKLVLFLLLVLLLTSCEGLVEETNPVDLKSMKNSLRVVVGDKSYIVPANEISIYDEDGIVARFHVQSDMVTLHGNLEILDELRVTNDVYSGGNIVSNGDVYSSNSTAVLAKWIESHTKIIQFRNANNEIESMQVIVP